MIKLADLSWAGSGRFLARHGGEVFDTIAGKPVTWRQLFSNVSESPHLGLKAGPGDPLVYKLLADVDPARAAALEARVARESGLSIVHKNELARSLAGFPDSRTGMSPIPIKAPRKAPSRLAMRLARAAMA